MKGLVSIVIPVYNRASMLAEAIASAVAQTYRPIEIIVVDDESTDDTPQTIARLATMHPEVRGIRRPNGGPGLARETGRTQARGEFIQYLDSDDLLLPRKLDLQVDVLQRDAVCGVAYGMTRYVDARGREIACTWKDSWQVQAAIFPSFLVARWWETSTPLYRASVCEAVGPWSDLRLEEDWEYDARVGSLRTRLAHVSEVVAVHRDHAEERLSRGVHNDPRRLQERARAQQLILSHARRAGVGDQAPEMQHFARTLFHLGRQCGAAGLPVESRGLIRLALSFAPAWDSRLYALAGAALGWTVVGRMAETLERLR